MTSFSSSLEIKDEDPDIEEGTPILAVATAGWSTVSAEYQKILPKETKEICWSDDFFDDEDGVIAVFDFDYDGIVSFETRNGVFCGMVVSLFVLLVYGPFALGVLGLGLVPLAPCFWRSQVRWKAEAKHLAITQEGIRYVQDRHKMWWGLRLSCCYSKKIVKTVPFDKITYCDIKDEGTAGDQTILHTINVDTESFHSANNTIHEWSIFGLKDPHGFKTLVWAMKSNLAPPPLELATSTTISQTILSEIRDELRQNNQLLRNTLLHKQGGEGKQTTTTTTIAYELELSDLALPPPQLAMTTKKEP